MQIVTLELLSQHCRTDGDDNELLAIYGNAAESAVMRAANRNFYLTTASMDAAVAGIEETLAEAYRKYDLAIEATKGIQSWSRRGAAIDRAETILRRVTLSQDMILHGLVLDLPPNWQTESLATLSGAGFDVVAAILLTAGHLYRNRENVVAGQGSAAVQVPQTAASLIEPLRWIGPSE